MGDTKLYLLLFLSTSLAFAQDEEPSCFLAKRYKTLHKYEYQYEAESLNAISGTSQMKNGPRASCKVDIEVPQACSFIVRTTGCSLSEVAGMDGDGNLVFRTAASSDAFAAEMEKYPLKVMVDSANKIKLYPEEGETTTILNIKRGIISALAVPTLEDNRYMPTIHGICKTTYSVASTAELTLNRDLSKCDKFVPIRDSTSPLALITGLHYPLAQLVRSSQTCNYKFDEAKNHMTSGSCVENHILIPFSHKGEYGVTNIGKQKLTLIEVSAHNDRVFDQGDIERGLHMEVVVDKSVIQDKDAALTILRELASLPETDGEERAQLFNRLVIMVRSMKVETLSTAIPKAITVSPVLTYQVLAQCGTPECSSSIMKILRGSPLNGLEVDAFVYAMGLVSNPSALLINDMLQMAEQKPSKPIMYALSNIVKRFYRAERKLVPEIFSVARFMAGQLGDCTGDKDKTFLTLRVIGNMAPAMASAGPAVRGAVLECVNKEGVSPDVQLAAIRVFRLTPVPEEGRETLMQVLLDSSSPVQKRIAAYLVLMKDPQSSELSQLFAALPNEQDTQFKNFVFSHINNILTSTQPQTLELRTKISSALPDNVIGPIVDGGKFSRNYKIGSVETNMIFDGSSYLPKEVMLEMTLKAFGYDIEMMEVGMEGTGFEPTMEALFGKDGFFPDTVLETMYFVFDKMPHKVSEILLKMLPTRTKRQASQSLVKDLGRNLNKLVNDLKSSEAPEATFYLRLLGNELGYMKTNDLKEMAYSVALFVESMLKMFPADVVKALTTMTDTSLYAHYMFMDNEFFLPTLTGVPLKITLTGTVTPGFKGGLKFSPQMNEVAFMPSAAMEFVSQIGSHIPEYVNSGLEMHTNFYHESGLHAKVTIERSQIHLSLPAPTTPTKLIKITNELVAVIGADVVTIPPVDMDKVDIKKCTPFFAGMKYCTDLQYNDAFYKDKVPYFPLTGDSKFAVELHPTGEVTEYTATLAYELLKEGEEGKQKVDVLKFILRAEGAEPTEARATLKYNRKRGMLRADFQIPDYDVEAGLRLGIVDGNTKGKGTHSISLDFINKNIPQLSLVGRAKLTEMKEGMLQVQMLVPAISTDATFTANLKRETEIELELKSDITVMEAQSVQLIALKYDDNKIEAEFKSDMNAKTAALPVGEVVAKYGEQFLDTQVGETDMKVRHIFKKFVEAANNYMERYGADLPYIQNFRVPDMPEMSLPEKIFLNTEIKAVYYFNNYSWCAYVPVPFGGMSTNDFNFPPVLITPRVSIPQIGLELSSVEIPMPELIVPAGYNVFIPFFGRAEVTTLLKSNLYDMEATVDVSKDVMEASSYSARMDVRGNSPIDILSVRFEGSGVLVTEGPIKAKVTSSLAHKFLEANVNIVEEASMEEAINLKSESKIDATSSLGLNVALEHAGTVHIDTEKLIAISNFDGSIKAGPIYGNISSSQSVKVAPFTPEAKIESAVTVDSTILNAENKFNVELLDGALSVLSNTKAFDGAVVLLHNASVDFKDQKLSLKSDANAKALGLEIKNHVEASAGAGEVVMRMETNSDHANNSVYTLLSASLDVNGLAVNSDATIKLLNNEAIHKANIKLNQEGLIVSGTNTLQSPLSLENTFNGGLDSSKATLSITNKAALCDMKVDNGNSLTITLSGIELNSKAEVLASKYATYTHDIAFNMKPYTASAKINNNLKLLSVNFINEGQLQAEFYKFDLTGSVKVLYKGDEIKHTYQINYADMTANAKCSTTGKVLDTHMYYNTELEVIGLAARLTNNAQFNSERMRFDHTVRCSVVPFDFNLDAIFNADGDVRVYGMHSAQLYGKFLLKAQPLAFASTQEWRASMMQQMDNGMSLESTFDNKMDTALSFNEQITSFRMKSKMNNHAFHQDMSLYNTAERMGIEMSNTLFTNLLNQESTENQKFAISGFLKYDKNTNTQVIQLPLMETFPVVLESIKGTVVYVAEALLDFVNDANVQAKLEAIPQYLRDFVVQLNLEDKLMRHKQFLSDLTQEYAITIEDVNLFLRNLNETVSKVLADLTFYMLHFVDEMKEIMKNMTLPDTIVQKIQEQLAAINEAFDIQAVLVYMIDTITEMIQQTDMEKLRGSVLEILINVDKTYNVKLELNGFLSQLKSTVENFDIREHFRHLKDIFISFDIRAHIDELMSAVPLALRDPFGFVWNVIQELDLVGKLNTFYTKVRELFVQLEVDQKVQAVLEKAVDVIQQFKIEDTFSAMIQMVKDSDIPTELNKYFQRTIKYVKTTEVKDIITNLNDWIKVLVRMLNPMEYNDLVHTFNPVFVHYTALINDYIKTLEIPQKFQITRDFVNYLFSTLKDITERLREIKVAEVVKSVQGVAKQVVEYSKSFVEYIKPQIENLEIKVPAISIAFGDIEQNIYALIDYILKLSFQIVDVDVDAFFGDMSFNFLPPMPEIAFPEITLSDITFPAIPEMPVEKFVKSLQVPVIRLPTIPSEIVIPSFGKLYGEIKVQTPMYTTKTTAELQNTTENEQSPKLTAFLTSQGVSPTFEILNYTIYSTAQLAIPKMSRVFLEETVRFEHAALGVDHLGSLNFYGKSAQARAKTTVKVTTTPYTGEFISLAFIAVEDGMSGSLETTYKHKVDLPVFDVKAEAHATQKAIARLDGLKFHLTVDNTGNSTCNVGEGIHKSHLEFSLTPSLVTLTFKGETETPFLKSSEIVATGQANLFDLKVEIQAYHDSELAGPISGTLSNRLKFVIRPIELILELKNKGTTKVNIHESLTAKMDVRSDWSALVNPEAQNFNTFNLVRLNRNAVFFNITVDNKENEAAVILGVDGQANLEFLTFPITIPEIDLPFVDFHTPEIRNLNLYEQTILKDILTTTEQSVSLDAKLTYKKSLAAPLVNVMGLIRVPAVGDFITDLNLKSAIINLNLKAALETQDDIVFRLGATTSSVFECLKAKLDGTTSLTTRRGLKLANSLSLENPHIEGTHNSTVSVSIETLETTVSVATIAKIVLPILSLQINQNLVGDTKTKPNAACTFRVNGDLNIPKINAVVKAEADHSLKVEATFEYILMESSNKVNMDGTFLQDFLVLGVLDNDLNLYLNKDGLRSTSKIIADTKLTHAGGKIFAMDVNENFAIEATLSRVYAILKYTGNNEANVFNFNTMGKHVAQGTVDFAPISALTAVIEINLAQPTNMGDFNIYEKATVEVTTGKQKISTISRFVSPVYTANTVIEIEGDSDLKVIAKSSATSPLSFLEYDIDASSTTSYENDALNMNNKAVLTNDAMTMDVNHVITQALRRKRQADDSVSSHTLNMDINSPTFTDMNLRYTASRNGISASLSSPSAGFLGLQINGKIPSLTGRLYGRYPSSPDADVDILVIRSSPKDANMMTLQVAYNMEAPKVMLSELEAKIPALVSTFKTFIDNNLYTRNMMEWKDSFEKRIDEAYNAAVNADVQLSSLSIFFRHVIVEFQRNVQVFLDAAIKVLRETQFKLLGSEEMTTLPVVLKELTSSIASVLRNTLQIIYNIVGYYYTTFVDPFSTIELRMPNGDVMTVGQFIDRVRETLKSVFDHMVDFVNNMESLDTMLVKIGETLKAVVDKTQEFVDSINSDVLNDLTLHVNYVYRRLFTLLKNEADKVAVKSVEDVNSLFKYIVGTCIYVVDQINTFVIGALQQFTDEAQRYVKVNDGRLELELPFSFRQ